jgi:hypothetical protein
VAGRNRPPEKRSESGIAAFRRLLPLILKLAAFCISTAGSPSKTMDIAVSPGTGRRRGVTNENPLLRERNIVYFNDAWFFFD